MNTPTITKSDRNKLKTPGYFIKRLRDNKFITLRVFQAYNIADPRKWTVLVDPGNTSLFITCYENKDSSNDIMFEFDDGGRLFPSNFFIKTHSIEIIIQKLVEKGVTFNDTSSNFHKPQING
jgi:hypothetical protein